VHAYIFHNIGFSSRNSNFWMKEIHMVKTMGIIIYAMRKISKSFGKPKNLFFLKVWKAICER
jgi:hypothetical protein